MENVRYNISPCSVEDAETFVGKIDERLYSERSRVRADEHSHYDRYAFMRGDSKVAVVYDTSAHVISITAPQDYADELLGVFGTAGRTVKRSTVPAHNGSLPRRAPQAEGGSAQTRRTTEYPTPPDTRAKVFVSPTAIRRRPETPTPTVIATSKGLEISTDEIFPPQRAKKRGEQNRTTYDGRTINACGTASGERSAQKYTSDAYFAASAVGASSAAASVGKKRKATISFGDCDDDGYSRDKGKGFTRAASPVRSGTGLYADLAAHKQDASPSYAEPDTQKKRRGRPRKDTAAADVVQPLAYREVAVPSSGGNQAQVVPEYKNGYSVRNFPEDKLAALLKRLKGVGYKVDPDGTEFAGTSQEVKMFAVSDDSGSRVFLRYATKKMTIQLQGKRSELFGELQSQVGRDSDYSSALEGYIESNDGGAKKGKVSDVENRLKRRLPTAYEFLSEQSRIDFSYGIHDFSQDMLRLSDYSVLLVPPYRGLERFIFDLQRAEDIKVKMIGQAYDKDNNGNYVLKNGYRQRIGSVIYCEVMVALYTEYFSRRNFFAHSDNSDDSRSRAIPDRAVAKGIFENLLDVVEYNAKKLKEIGFSVGDTDKTRK